MATETTTNPVVSDQKKRAMEALERRFAVVKADLLQQQHKNHKKRALQGGGGDGGEERRGEGEEASLASPEPHTSTKKGHFASSDYAPRRGAPGVADQEACVPAYFELSQPVHENLLRPATKISSRGVSAVNKIVHDLLQSGDSAQKYMQGSRKMKIDNYLFLDSYVSKTAALMAARVKALQSHSKRSNKHMSMQQHRKCGTFDLPGNFHKFELFKPMHEMWKGYIIELVKDSGKDRLSQCLLMADLHGAIIQVVECKTTAFTGIQGIMIRETAETFGIITEENKFRVVPKKGSVFIYQAGSWKITLYGDKLSSRNIGNMGP